MATAPPKRTYFDYRPSYAGTVQKGRTQLTKVPKGQTLRYTKDKGYWAGPKLTKQVVRPGTGQNDLTPGIETPAQIEQRVSRMAKQAFLRERNAVTAEADRLRKDAEGRRLGMIAAYKAAGEQNAGLGEGIQAGWTNAAQTLQGLAGTTTGAVGSALQADVSSLDEALSRVGAGGTGYDARSQAGVEQYRGGYLPAERMTRLGAIGREELLRSGINFQGRGMQEGYAAEAEERAGIRTDSLARIAELGAGRTKYEGELRAQMLEARGQQLEVAQKADEAVAEARDRQAKLKQQYTIALMSATTDRQKLQIDRIYKEESLRLKGLETAALNAQRYAGANLSDVRAQDILLHPGTGGGSTKKPKTVAEIAKDAAGKIGQGGINLPKKLGKNGKPLTYRQKMFDYLWTIYGESVPPGQRGALKKKLMALAARAPVPTPRAGDVLGGIPG